MTAFALVVVFTWNMVYHPPAQTEEERHLKYCEKVAVWKAGKAVGIELSARKGRPNKDNWECENNEFQSI